jgi:hypothetical protein
MTYGFAISDPIATTRGVPNSFAFSSLRRGAVRGAPIRAKVSTFVPLTMQHYFAKVVYREAKANDAINREERNQVAEAASEAGPQPHLVFEQRATRTFPSGGEGIWSA